MAEGRRIPPYPHPCCPGRKIQSTTKCSNLCQEPKDRELQGRETQEYALLAERSARATSVFLGSVWRRGGRGRAGHGREGSERVKPSRPGSAGPLPVVPNTPTAPAAAAAVAIAVDTSAPRYKYYIVIKSYL